MNFFDKNPQTKPIDKWITQKRWRINVCTNQKRTEKCKAVWKNLKFKPHIIWPAFRAPTHPLRILKLSVLAVRFRKDRLCSTLLWIPNLEATLLFFGREKLSELGILKGKNEHCSSNTNVGNWFPAECTLVYQINSLISILFCPLPQIRLQSWKVWLLKPSRLWLCVFVF